MSKNSTVTLTIKLRDTASPDLRRLSQEQIDAARRMNDALRQQANQVRTVNAARTLGIRTEQQIRQEMAAVTRAYFDLRRSGLATTGDLNRANEQMTRRLQALRNEIRGASGDLDRMGRAGSGGNRLQTAAAVVGGAYAAGTMGSNYLKDPREYMKQISYATDTALAGQKMSVPDFNKKVTQMEGWVRESTVKGGSSPQQMTQALNTLVASNVYDFDQIKDVLLQVSSTAFASGADANDVAAMTVAQKNFGLTDLTRANDQAMKAGQLGSFELRDMARYMPDLLTQGRGAGYIGEKGYKDLLVMMQLSKKTAGTAEGAAVNLSDLLGSFSQHHLGLSFAKHVKLEDGDPLKAYGVSKKRKGFDWTTYAANMREKGIGEVEAAAMLMQRQMDKNPNYQKYKSKAQEALKSGNDAAYLENLQAATQIVAQGEIGKIFHNKQALMAFMGYTMNMQEGGFKDRLDLGINDSDGTVKTSQERQAAQEHGKDGSFDTARFNARADVYNGVAGWLGDTKQWLADFASSNNGVAAAASAATLGLTAVAGAAGIAALTMRGGGAGNVLGAAAATAGNVLRTPVGTTGSVLAGSMAGRLAMATGVGLAGAGGWYLGSKISENLSDETNHNIGGTIATIMSHLPDWMGGDTAREALAAEMSVLSDSLPSQNDQMIQQNERLIKAVERLQIPVSSDMLPLSEQLKQQANRGLPYW